MVKISNNKSIGIFDSGVGGLTAMKELSTLLPDEHIIYLGDSRNMPYGEKTREEIIAFSRKSLAFLLARDVKAVFIACGTATVTALDVLRAECPVPIFGVVDAAVDEALAATHLGRVGVLATRASINAKTFQEKLREKRSDVVVVARACPVFATMVEYGIFDKNDRRVRLAAAEYLPPLCDAWVDTVILGCTHYPLLSDVITQHLGGNVTLISSGAAAARALAVYLRENDMLAESGNHKTEIFTTGSAKDFAKSAKLMLKRDITDELTAIAPLI